MDNLFLLPDTKRHLQNSFYLPAIVDTISMMRTIFNKVVSIFLSTLILAAIACGVWYYLKTQADKTIGQLLTENKQLKNAITNLKKENQIGYAKVISQTQKEGQLITKLKFVETARDDKLKRIVEKQFDLPGDIIHFDALIVKFDEQLVMDGKERAMYLWRRVYSEKMNPEEGLAIETQSGRPRRYADITAKLDLDEEELFWDEIWKLADDNSRLAQYGIRAVYGSVIYRKIKPGCIYVFKISDTGTLYTESYPDL